ncbi:hypothetical protein BC939DRAFT_460227 [Gamsiella multidivaricata]|uniref:uncharacterized protein n=1 Tax=Gamsiella multidivaricata TaxID=101098 RepID=UPI00221E81EF|nr:uncharacterized protein BC939DRAFT_460227 [Gamsiella multidivaricata]KAI7819430.1 hypothetical protein BC939DRAFT_460227 [Gamsiella multidivaricata]
MNQLGPLLLNYVEQQARPHVETKVTEQLNDTKGDLKSDLPSTIMSFLTGKDGSGEGTNPMVSQIISQLGPNFMNRLTSVTNMTVDTSSEGMDTLLTNGVINTAKNVLTQQSTAANGGAPETGGIDFDFFKNGKEGMVNSAMTASMPIIKQVSENMGNKMSSSFPAAIGGAIQQLIDENGSANGALGTAAGLMSKFMGSHGPGDQPVNGGGDAGDVHATGGQTGGIQQLFQNLLSPKILLLLQPYLQKFEVQMASTSFNRLSTAVNNELFGTSTKWICYLIIVSIA